MDTNNWRPTAAQGAEPSVETGGDWRTQLPPDSRQRIVNKIMETLKRHLPFSGQEGLEELKKIAVRFEEKIYTAAMSQSDYLRKISLKMLTMESKSQTSIPNSLPPNPSGNNNRPPDSGASHNMQPQVHNQGQALPMAMSANQSQARQQILSQNIPTNMGSTGVQSSASLTSSLPPVSGLSQTSIPNVVGQNPTMQNISGVSQSSSGNSMGQGVPSNMFANPQRQMQGRQQVVPQQQQQQPQNSQQYLYQQQLLKQKFHQQGNLQHTLVQSHMQQQQQQQQQQNILQPTSQQSSMQTSSVMQPSMIQSANLSGLQQNQPSSAQQSGKSMLQHPQSVLRQQQQMQQAASVHQQQPPMMQQSLLPTQQQQQLMSQQPNAANMQQNQLTGQQNNVGDMQQQPRLLGQQNNLQNLQQHQQQQQQQQHLMAQQNNLSSLHQQQLGSQSNVSGLQQQQQLLGTQPGNSTMQTNQHSSHMLQRPKVPLQQQTQQNASNMLPAQGHQSQQQLSQHQLMSQMQSQPTQLQQQLGLQQQPNQIQRDMQPGLQASSQVPGSLLQQQNVIDPQKQLYQSQRPLPETSSTSLDSTAQTGNSNGGDWQEEVHQKIKTMKEMYLPELNEMHQKIASKLQMHDSLPQPPKSEQLEKLKIFKTMLERIISFLQVSKSNILPTFKEKLGSYEKQIINFISSNKLRKSVPPLQQGQLGQPHMQQPQSQVSQVQSNENQMNPQIQSMNMQGSVPNMQQNNMAVMQHTSLSSLSGVSTSQQTLINSLQPTSSLDSGQGTLQQNSVSAPQQGNLTNFSSQSGVNMLQPNIPLQSNPNMLQHQHLKQQQEQMMQSQQFKQRQMQQQLLKQQMLQQQQQQQQQQFNQQAKQQLPAQMQAHQMQQGYQMNDINELKLRQGMGVKPGVFQQHISGGQRTPYTHQQMKSAASFPISSPQLLQAASPQLSQNSSPQIDQQNLLSSLTKAGTPLQSANSPFIVPSPSTPLAPSPMPGDSEKPVSGLSSLSNAGNIGQQQATVAQPPAPSLAIGTPGISASPLLAEFTVSDGGGHGNGIGTIASGKSSVTEQPLERLIKAVKSMSSQALSASVSDIGSVVSMIDRIAGSAPGNGSRAAVGEDLVAMTNCRLQARNVITQDGMTGTRKMKRYTSAMPLNVVSSAGSVSDSFKFSGPDTSDLESTATSSVKRPRLEANHALLEEIREINLRLIDTVVDVSEEDVDPTTAAAAAEGGDGTIVKCSFIAVALSPNLKSQYASAQMSPIQPLRLLVPTNYPSCSPILLDKLPVEISKEYEDLSVKAKSRFGISLRTLSQPMSLGEIARTWDVCARAVISEHAQQSGGGSFSSKYGTWENCLSAA
ncbi:mediator of RNA polymerase II transcription subunit 15a-like [Euphorbia lathyris]|uniref:mediator of RNA polymerase II transcription subunit 15a-like n=1 Tax=Euphorbia lathyris TaxID=212925 RepID=UPI0033144B68